MVNLAASACPICAASEQFGRRHRVGINAYVVHDSDGREWRLCSARCMGMWSPVVSRAPTLPAYTDRSCWVVYCAHCRDWHRHSPGDGHRAAHCWRAGSPYRVTGYVLEYAGRVTAEVRRSRGRRGGRVA
jgi:hypothetical protein